MLFLRSSTYIILLSSGCLGLLLHTSTPLTVHRIPMHFDLNGGAIALRLCLSMTRIGYFSSQSGFIVSTCLLYGSSGALELGPIGIVLSSTFLSGPGHTGKPESIVH